MRKIKNIAVLRIVARRIFYFIYGIRYKFRGLCTSVDEHAIVFCAYGGRSYACSPRQVYERLLGDERFAKYKFFWILDNPEQHKDLDQMHNTAVIKKGSKACEKILNTSKYWIFNFRAADHWKPKKEQIYVQCWHGTPLKKLGYDLKQSDNAMNSIWEIREKYRSDAKRFDYLLSSCGFVTEKFLSAWNLGTDNKKILEIGYPRNDNLSSYSEEKIKEIKSRLGIAETKKKIILYAPTWRDNQHDMKHGYIYETPVDFDMLSEELKDEYIILFRAHYLVVNNFNFDKYKGIIYNVSDYDDINDLYIVSDLLITDYSSVFFDYAILNKPIIFYMYDKDLYRDSLRGFYIDINELPGPIVEREKELIYSIKQFEKNSEWERDINEFNKKYNLMNDGHASDRLINIVFGGQYEGDR